MTIKDWLEGLSYKLVQGSLDVEVNEVVYDSRKAAPGAVFVCMKGTKIDSHDFIPQVTEAGVKVLVTEHPVETPEDVTVVETENGGAGSVIGSTLWLSIPEAYHDRGNRYQGKDHHHPYDQDHSGDCR